MNILVLKLTLVMVVVFNFFTVSNEKLSGIIYILEWTKNNIEPFNYLGFGQDPFIKNKCDWQNCYLVADHSLFNDILDYDVLLFNVVNLQFLSFRFPPNRSEVQQYVLVGLEPSSYCHIRPKFNGFFNLTWTYKLNSDVPYPYIAVKNMDNELIGPRTNMQWIDINEMLPTREDVLSKLKGKSIAAAWISSNCDTMNERLEFANNLSKKLFQYGHEVHFYGACGNYKCHQIEGNRNGDISGCADKIKSDYYFYFAFENSFCEDYVTEKVIHGLKNFAVPVVYGGANYSRFMPDGIYLNAKTLGVEEVAEQMYNLIINPQRYSDFFKWHSHYSFHDTDDDRYRDAVCGLCAVLNNRTLRAQRKVYTNITEWWNSPVPDSYNYYI